MGSIDKGKGIGVRWSDPRYKNIERLGWTELDEGTVLDRALERSVELENVAYKIDKCFRGELNLLELISQLNDVRKYK